MRLNDKFEKISPAIYEVLSRHNYQIISRQELVIKINSEINGNIKICNRSLHHLIRMVEGYNIKLRKGQFAINTNFSFKCLCGCGGYTKGGFYLNGHNRYHRNKKSNVFKGSVLGSNVMVD